MRGQTLVKHNSKNIITLNGKLVKLHPMLNQMVLLTPSQLTTFNLLTGAFSSAYTLPSDHFTCISFKPLPAYGLTLLLVAYSAYQDRTTSDFLQTDISFTDLQELHLLLLLPPTLTSAAPDLAQDLRLQTSIHKPTGFKYLAASGGGLLVVYGENTLEFYSLDLDSVRMTADQGGPRQVSKVRFRVKGAGQNLMNPSSDEGGGTTMERVELEHSERQELMRDMSNRIVREEVDVLESHKVFKKENIIKVLAREEQEGVVRLWVISDAGWIYTYHLYVVMSSSGSKL